LSHTPQEIEIAFKKEGLYGEVVETRTEMDGLTSLHSICAVSDGRELARIRINWANIEC